MTRQTRHIRIERPALRVGVGGLPPDQRAVLAARYRHLMATGAIPAWYAAQVLADLENDISNAEVA